MTNDLIHTIPCESRTFEEHEEEEITLPHIRVLRATICPVCEEAHSYGNEYCVYPRTYKVCVEELKLQEHR